MVEIRKPHSPRFYLRILGVRLLVWRDWCFGGTLHLRPLEITGRWPRVAKMRERR